VLRTPFKLLLVDHPFKSYSSRRWVWAAICILTLSAMMPTLTAWVASARASVSWQDVCSTNRTSWIQLVADQAPGDAGSAQHNLNGSGHCPFCLLQDHTPVLPVMPLAPALANTALAVLVPPLLLHAPRPLHAWSPIAARAPPLTA
jgi:Protein of unknown function (DUF2946)